MRTFPSMPRRQRGVATLTVAMLLLFAMALIAFFAHRSLLVEQRSTANQVRATRAFELSEAGLEWAKAMLDDPRPIDAQCRPSAGGRSFRDTYVPLDAAFMLAPAGAAHPSCRVASGGMLACSCPLPGENAVLGNGDDPSFSVGFAAIAGQGNAVRLEAAGCTGQGVQCIAGSGQSRTDAVARSSVVLALRPLLRALPAATLTAGGAVSIGAGVGFGNVDAATRGSLVVAGGPIDAAAASLTTLAGSPVANALYAGDASLDVLAQQGGDAVFNAFFGMTLDRFRRAGAVLAVSGSSASERAAALRAGHEQGYDAFFADGDLLFDAAGIGSAERPVLIVTSHAIACSAPCQFHGLLYADVAARDPNDLANLSLRGALVTRGQHTQTQGGEFTYDAGVLATLRGHVATFARVPGSWRDF